MTIETTTKPRYLLKLKNLSLGCLIGLVGIIFASYIWEVTASEGSTASGGNSWSIHAGYLEHLYFDTGTPSVSPWTLEIHLKPQKPMPILPPMYYQDNLLSIGRCYSLMFPLWRILIPFLLAWIIFVFICRMKRHKKSEPGHCTQCGYNLCGSLSGACPECGKPGGDGVRRRWGQVSN